MNYRAKLSSWDSDLFNCRVGSLEVTHVPRLERIKEDNRETFDVVFVKVPGWVEVSGATALDYRYDMELFSSKKEARKYPITVTECVHPKHLEIASKAFSDSRFHFDPHLSSRAYEIYPRWLSSAETIYTLPGERREEAFVTVEDEPDGDARRISLIAVSEKMRSAGIGQALVRGIFHFEKRKTWRVRVSARNYRAIRFYENLGFRVREVSTAFHVWTAMDES